ncbi:hypothetical protein GGR14_003410 [Butyricimonas faecihominis]|uniref:Uncharacterized protein n=2 Tax=Butyricimonas TaxID=574697 RepID=A0A7W6HZ18_9BACT|nr:hypothetical protein [Butyricimonas faecihominis]NJC19258.1 hypothetical protein [Butyricimonas paravirosa]
MLNIKLKSTFESPFLLLKVLYGCKFKFKYQVLC